MSQHSEIIAAPYTIWVAPAGTAFPDIGTTPGEDWIRIGTSGDRNYAAGGVAIQHQSSFGQSTPAGASVPSTAFVDTEQFRIRVELLDMTLEQYSEALGRNSVSLSPAAPGVVGYRTVGLSRPLRQQSVMSLLARGVSPYGEGLEAQYEVPRCQEVGSPQLVFTRGQPTRLAIEYMALENPNAKSEDEIFGRLIAQDQAALPPVVPTPTISGTANIGQVLTGEVGTIAGGVLSGLQWLRDGGAIPGATGSTYTLVNADSGKVITLLATATGAGGEASATSAPTAIVSTLAVLEPSADWDGTLGSGFGGAFAAVPTDPTRTTGKPALRLIVPPNQHFTETLDVGVIAMANDDGSLLDNFGIDNVRFVYEGGEATVSASTLHTIQTERGARTYFGWWVRLRKPSGTAGKAQLYIEATANDATMQKRVIGPYNFSPIDTEYDLELEINPDLPEVAGERYQSFWPAISYARTQLPHNPRFLITKAGKYEIERNPANDAEAPTDQYDITGRYTIEASVPGVSIGRLGYETDVLAQIPGHRTYWRFRGSNLTYDTRYVTNLSARAALAFPDDVQHWMDGITITTSDPNGKDELFRGGTTPRSSQVVLGRPIYTECQFINQNTPANNALLVRGCHFENSSQDIISNSLCAVHNSFDRSDQLFWNGDAVAGTVTIPPGDTLAREGGNYSSGTNGGLWTAVVGGVTYTFDVGNGSFAYFAGTATYRGVSGVGGYWVSDVFEWLNSLPGWSATISSDFETRDRVAAALSRPGLKGQGFDGTPHPIITGDGTPRTLTWCVDTHGDWYQHTSGELENVMVAFNRAWHLETQMIFLAPILSGGTAASRDMFFVANSLSADPVLRAAQYYDPNAISSQLSRSQDMSHVVIAHNTVANQRILPNFSSGNVRDQGYNLMKNNTFRAFIWNGGVVAPDMVVDGLLIHEGQSVPDGVSNYIVRGTAETLYADPFNGDFAPTALLKQEGFEPAVPFDGNAVAFPDPAAPGAVPALADVLLVPPVIPEPTDVLGPDGLALASALGEITEGGMWLFSAASNPGLWRATNLAGAADDFIQGTAAAQPSIGTDGATFDANDQVNSSLFSGLYDFYILLRKDAGSTVGQIIRNNLILAEGSSTAASVAAGSSVLVNGDATATRDDLFTALDAEISAATQWAEVRVENLALSAFELGRSGGDAFQGDILAVVAIPRFATETPEQLAALHDLARAWMLELKPGLPAYAAIAPSFTASSISGTPEDGQVLTANATVTGDAPITLAYQWQYNGTDISGQTAQTITLDQSGMGLFNGGTISCEISATNAGGSASDEPSVTFVSDATPAQAALEAELAAATKSGMYDCRTASDDGSTLSVANLSGGLGAMTQNTAANKPAISATNGLGFDGSNDRVGIPSALEPYTVDLLMRKGAGSTTGHVVAGLRLYTDGSAIGMGTGTTTVDGVAVTTRDAFYEALNDGDWHHVRFTALTATSPGTIFLGQTAAAMLGDVKLAIAINEVEFSGTPLDDARAASAAWIAEQLA